MNVNDIMTPYVITVRDDATVADAVQLMLSRHISGLPVVDAKGNLVGIVTEGDFLRRVESGTQMRRPRWVEVMLGPGRMAGDYVHSHARKVAEVMSREVATTTADTPAEEAVALMERKRVKRLPVLRDGRLVGIVSRANLLRSLLAGLTTAPAVAANDSELRTRIFTELQKQDWFPRATVDLTVRDGVVRLAGVIFDARERAAMRVAVENVPGVRGIDDQMVLVDPLSGLIIT